MSRFFMILAALVPLLCGGAADAEAADPGSRVVYGGRLEDAQGRPIGGIFPLTFSFYRTEKGGRAMWSEAHFVAVDNGLYAVELGLDKPFPRTLDLARAWISVSANGKEIVRDRFVPEEAAAPPAAPAPAPAPAQPKADPAVGAPPQPAKGTYADQAGFAYEAEKARTAESVGGLTAVDLRNLIKQSTAETPRETQKVRVGESKRFTEQVGGLGGQPFTLQCPPGHVVTGIRGQAAGYVDQIALICSPLE